MSWILFFLGVLSGIAIGFVFFRRRTQGPASAHLETSDQEEASYPPSLGAELKERNNQLKLVIANISPAAAKDIRTYLDNVPMLEHNKGLKGPDPGFTLGPGSSVSYDLAYKYRNELAGKQVKNTYTDVYGKKYSTETTFMGDSDHDVEQEG